MTLEILTLGVYLLLLVGVGFVFSRTTRNAGDFIRGGARATWWMVGSSILVCVLALAEIGGIGAFLAGFSDPALARDFRFINDPGTFPDDKFTLKWAVVIFLMQVFSQASLATSERYLTVKTGADARKAAWADNAPGGLLENGSRFALFHRPPDVDRRLADLPARVAPATASRDHTGHALFMLRRGPADNPTVFTMHHHKIANSHTHYDALSTILWAEGREMLSDIGYALFGIRERSTWYIASLSHNTLTVDTINQRAPNGVANFIYDGELFSACEGESWDSYRFICEPFTRQIALVDTPSGRPYAVDCFRGGGGRVHDFALHGEGPGFEVRGLALESVPAFSGKDYAYEEVRDVRKSAPTDDDIAAAWSWPDGAVLDVRLAGQDDTRAIATRSPGMRTRDQQGREIHSFFARRQGEDLRSAFVGVYDPHQGEPVVQDIEKLHVSAGAEWAVVLKVRLRDAVDYILSSYIDIAPMGEVFRDGDIAIPWQSRFGVVRVRDGKIIHTEWVDALMEGLQHDI